MHEVYDPILTAAKADMVELLPNYRPDQLNSDEVLILFLENKARRCILYIHEKVRPVTYDKLREYDMLDIYLTLIRHSDNVYYLNAS